MADLTQDWEDGKLLGLYWCKITVSPYIEMVYVDGIDNDYMIEVLAKVPSYDEWMEIKNVCFDNEVLRLENGKLKEQLEMAIKTLEEVIKENEGCMDCTSSLPAKKLLKILNR